MKELLGGIIYNSRLRMNLTQDRFGAKYGISGPAVFKFEKGYVSPSLELWMRISADAEVDARRAVLLWLKARLPAKYQDYIEMQGAAAADLDGRKKKGGADYNRHKTAEAISAEAGRDRNLPSGLKELLVDQTLLALYKPTGDEIHTLRDVFGGLGRGEKRTFLEALRLMRAFRGTA